ncbi:MAG TPA: hypothetical protein VMG38_00925 [Trebonia sp.]|nr:hypothetical protein [Trebonia sp.]
MTIGRWPGRVVRGLRPDSNPLRRRIDRAEAFIFGGLLVAAATVAPIAAVQAGHVAYTDSLRVARVQEQTGHQTTAVLLAPPSTSGGGYSIASLVPATARWKTPAGTSRTGDIQVPPATAKGEHVKIWTDEAGDVTSPPATQEQAAGQGTFAAIMAVVLTLVTCFSAAGITRLIMNRRRMAAWEADWTVTAPMWTRQRWLRVLGLR